MDVDLIERCRARDRSAYRGLFALWGDQALKVALRAVPERARAEAAVGEAFVAAWTALPSLHTERPFRPWLMAGVARAALAGAAPGNPALAAIVRAGRAMQADRAVRAILADAGAVALRQTFFDGEVAPRLEDSAALEVRRLVAADREAVWAVLTDAAALSAWTETASPRARPPGRLEPGARIVAGGRVAGRARSRDRTLVTRAEEPRLLAWTTGSRIVPWPGTIEFRWAVVLSRREGGCEALHRLLGVAFPPGAGGRPLERAYRRVEAGMHASMHRGIERLAARVEARARRA